MKSLNLWKTKNRYKAFVDFKGFKVWDMVEDLSGYFFLLLQNQME
jgi:hypothetical protein